MLLNRQRHNCSKLLSSRINYHRRSEFTEKISQRRAHWENWKNCRLTDNITITTALLLFMDVNVLVEYKPSDSDKVRKYIIKSVSHDFSNFTTTINMMRFYPLYESVLQKQGTHETLAHHSHEYLSRYTHEQLVSIIAPQEF